jgi:asparagine synthase (glutamine-hydrolysing)
VCGILGVGGERGAELVRSALGGLAHRGPDGEGIWSSPELTLGHRRLAIIGLGSEGDQPMWSRSGQSVIVFHGEIYDYLELFDRLSARGLAADRRFDTAVLLEALEAWGPDVLPDLGGMFAFAWYRPARRELLLARDRWGKKPLFWGRVLLDDGTTVLAFASELRTLARLPCGPPPVCPLGVARHLVSDGLPGEATVYDGIRKVAAGTWLLLDPDGRQIDCRRYWSLARDPREITERDALEELRARLDRAVELRLRSDVPVGLFLSGGLDSSLLAASWRRIRPEGAIRTSTVGFDDASYDERVSARVVAAAIGSEQLEIVATGRDLERELEAVWSGLSEPFGDPSIVPTSLPCRFARERVTVALGGDGGDELQAGYDPFRAWTAARLLERVLPRRVWYRTFRLVERALPQDARNMTWRFRVRHFGQGFLHEPEERIPGWMASFALPMALLAMKPDLAERVDTEEVVEPSRRAFQAGARSGELWAQIHTWIATYLEASILTKIDRASMLHSLEARTPFLDPVLAEFLLGLPDRFVCRRGRGKVLLRRSARDLLPPAVLAKPKKGLGVPQTAWLRTILRERFESCLESTRSGGWCDHGFVDRLWREHLSGAAEHRKPRWNFLFSFPFQER